MSAAFWASALALVALAWSLLWVGSRGAPASAAPGGRNAAFVEEELAALDAERLDAERHREATVGLQRRLLAEAGASGLPAASPAAARRLLGLLALALPAFVIGGYLLLGNPAALNVVAPPPPADDVSQADVEKMVDTLATRLRAAPAGRAEDLPGWVMLARSQAALRRFGDAASAYERAVALAPDDPQLLADLADVLTLLQAPGRAADAAAATPAADRAHALVDRALALDPQNLKALALAGNAAFERRDTAAAIGFWRRARALAPAGSEFADGLDRNLADAGAAPPPAGEVPAPDATVAAAAPPVAAAAQGPGRTVVADIRVAPALAGRIGPGDTVFVFARAVDGPRMPLAIVRRPAATLPARVALDDAMAMSPALRLSNFGPVVVEARISRSGDAMPQPGDLIGEGRVDAGDGRLEIVIDRQRP